MSMCVAFWGFAALAQMAPGSALNLNGINGYASVALGETLTNYTLSAWVYLRSGGAFANPRVAVVSSTCGATTEFLIRGTNSTSDVQYLELGRCFQYEGAVSIASVPLNTWVQVSVTVTNRPDGNFVSFYTNGISAGVTVLPLTNDISLGPNVALGYNDGSSRKFDGYLDEVQIWRGVVPPITTHVLNGAETNLRAYYRFDEGTGSSSANLAIATNASSTPLLAAVCATLALKPAGWLPT